MNKLNALYFLFLMASVANATISLQDQENGSDVTSTSSSGLGIEYRTNSAGEICWIYYYGVLRSAQQPKSKTEFAARLNWQNMPRLIDLEIKHCDVSRPLLEYVSGLTSIKNLTIGTEPDEIFIAAPALESLRNMKGLKSLFLVDKSFSPDNLTFLKGLKNLELFYFHHGRIEDSTFSILLDNGSLTFIACDSIGKLTPQTVEKLKANRDLRHLDFCVPNQPDKLLQALACVNSLEHLGIETDWEKVSNKSLQRLAELSMLRRLEIKGKVSGVLSRMPKLPNLEELVVDGRVVEPDLAFLKKFANLRSFRAMEMRLKQCSVSHLPENLERLYLNSTHLPETEFDKLDRLKEYSFLSKTKVARTNK